MKCTKIGLRTLAALAVLVLISAVARPLNAGTLSADTIGLFPKNVGEFAYADLKKARTMKWYPALQEQMLPERFRQFEKFLASAGVDPNTQVDELAWGLIPDSTPKPENGAASDVPSSEQIVGVALGTYNPSSTEAYFKQQKLPTVSKRGYTLFAFGSGAGQSDLFFFFIDSSKAAFGHRQQLERLIEIRYGAEEGLLRNDKMYSLINEINGTGVVWAVLDAGYTRPGDGPARPRSAAISRCRKTSSAHGSDDHLRHCQQRPGRKVPGGLRQPGRCQHPQPTDDRGLALQKISSHQRQSGPGSTSRSDQCHSVGRSPDDSHERDR